MKKINMYIRKLLPAIIMLLAVPSFSQMPLLRETVWMQCTSDIFVAGEEIRFKATVLETDTYKPSVLSNNLRVELINNNGEVIFQSNYVLKGSSVTSAIQLPSGLSTGWYHLRAYTNWMRNFPVSDFSWNSIRIIQPADFNDLKYRLENDDVHGISPSEAIYSAREEGNNKPKIILNDGGSFINVRVENLRLTGNYKLLAHKTYSWYWYRQSHTVTDNIEFAIPKSSLPKGIVQFSFLNNTNELLASVLWSDHSPGNERSKILNFSDKAEMRKAYSADYQLSTTHNNNIDVLVIKENPYFAAGNYIPGLPGWTAGYQIPAAEDSFRAWLMENSYPEDIVMEFFRSTDSPRLPTSSPEGFQIRYLPETRNGVLSGRVVNSNDGSGVEEVYLGLTILNNGTFHSSVSDKNGYFVFTFPEATGPVDYIINFIRDAKPEWQINIDRLYETIDYLPETGPVKFTTEELEYLQEQAELLQLKIVYNTVQTDSISNNNHTSDRSGLEFYGNPDLRVVVDDFVSLSNLREIVYEVVPYVSIRNIQNYDVPVISSDNLYPSPYPSLLLFDGIPVYDYTEILKLPPERFKKIDVINQFYIHGNTFFSGILNIESVNQDFGGLDLPETSIIGSIGFPEKQGRDNINPEFADQKTIPALDNILLWKSIQAEENDRITYATGDIPGKYRIMIYGYDEKGNWVQTSEFFTIESGNQ